MASGGLVLPRAQDLAIQTIKGFRDHRGVLFPAELPALINFAPIRLFWITDVPAGEIRGGHGHRLCRQFLICCAGRIGVVAFDGVDEKSLTLEQGQAVLLPSGLYATQAFIDAGSMLLVLCDQAYDASDYIHTRDELAAFRGGVTTT
jgi:hypothetical protein